MDATPAHVERRQYDRRSGSSDTALVAFLVQELDRARQRIAELELQLAARSEAPGVSSATDR